MKKKKPSDPLSDLEQRIVAVKTKHQEKESDAPSRHVGAMRVGIELGAGIAVGCVLGHYLDVWLETRPVFFITGFFFGVAGGFLNLYNLATRGDAASIRNNK